MPYDATAADLQRQSEAARDLIRELQSDDTDLLHDMTEGETSLFEAIDRAMSEIDDCAITVAGCKEREAQLAERRDRAARRQDRLRGLIEQAMAIAGLEKIKRPCATFSVARVNPKPMIHDEAAIPAAYWRQADPVLDKAAINAAVKDGAIIPGVSMTNGGTTLKIRRS